MPTNYAVDYSVMQVKNMIQRSEQRPHPLNPGVTGHAFARHGGVSNADLQTRSAGMMGNNQDASAFMNQKRFDKGFGAFDDAGNLVSTDYWEMLKLNDQAFIVANVLNSRFGQCALELLNHTMPSRLTISAVPFNDTKQRPVSSAVSRGAFSIMDFSMRVSTSGGPVSNNQLIGRLTIILEGAGTMDGYPELHFVTAFPIKAKQHARFGLMAGAGRKVSFGGHFATTETVYKWSSIDQNDGNATLDRLP